MIVCVGEILIDFVALSRGRMEEVVSFSRNAGGAPANVAVWLAALGQQVGFLGAVGDDSFGRYLRLALAQRRVDASMLQQIPTIATTLAFVSLTPAGERNFEFFSGAHSYLQLTAAAEQYVSHVRALHFGSVSLSREPARTSTWQAVETARRSGAIINFDATIRPTLWPDASEIAEQCWRGIRAADIVKLSAEEAAELTDEPDPPTALDSLVRYLGEQARPSLIALTLGAAGSLYLHRPSGLRSQIPPQPVRRVVDTTGAGDAFTAGMLAAIVASGIAPAQLDEPTIRRAMQQGSRTAARVVTQRGAWPRHR